MRVLIANKYFFPNGGSERVMFDERDSLMKNGIEVVDFSMEHRRNLSSPYQRYFVKDREYRSGGVFARIPRAASLIHSREAVSKICALIDETHPDILHCHNIYHQITPSIIGAAKLSGIPVVLTLHDTKPICPIHTSMRDGQLCSLCRKGDFTHVVLNRCADGSLANSLTLYVEAVVQRWLGNYEQVDRFLAPSRFMRDSVLDRFPAEKVAVLYNGVDTTAIRPAGRDDGYILYCGRLAAGKGIETLLQVHETLGSPWPLVVAGVGPMSEKLRTQFTQNVRFAGHLSGDALTTTLANAAVVVLPSEWPENCPMALMEAMAHGKPVIGSRIGGIPELIIDGVTGLLFEPGDTNGLADSLRTVMESPVRRSSMGFQARRWAEQEFSLSRHAADLIHLYASLARPSVGKTH